MRSDRARADAALVLALGLLAATMARAPRVEPARPCPGPHAELMADAGRTVAVSCAAGPGPARSVRGAARLLVGLPIELNRADADTLGVLPGIGPARAAAILQARCRRPFRSLDDVLRVPGIGPRTLERLRGEAVAGGPRPDCPATPTLPP